MKPIFITMKIKADIKRLKKYIKILNEQEYQLFALNFEEEIIINNSMASLDKNQLNKHVYYERLLYALNYLKLVVAYKEFELEILTIDCNQEDKLIDQAEIKSLNKLMDNVVKNPIGYTTINALYECFIAYDEEMHTNTYMGNAFKYLENKDGLYHNYLSYFKMRYENDYNHKYLIDTLFSDYEKRYSIFNAIYYGKNLKSITKAIADYDLESYQKDLDDEYVKVLDKLY